MNPLLEKFQGCLAGVAVGDSLGAPLEGLKKAEVRQLYGYVTEMVGGGRLRLEPGEYTDDTAMTLALARSLVEKGCFDPKDVASRFLSWFEGGAKGIGRTTYYSLSLLRQGLPWQEAAKLAHERLGGMSAGNGSIMRCAPLALFHFQQKEALIADSITSSRLTHWDAKACWGAAAVNLAISFLLEKEKAELLPFLEREVQNREVREAVVKVSGMGLEDLSPTSFVLDTIQVALWCFLNTYSFEQALVAAVNLGGDADTSAAVCGSLCGAYYGITAIPIRWRLLALGGEELASLAARLYSLATKA